jgi:tRNA(His) 5'-end guanylyltransferase
VKFDELDQRMRVYETAHDQLVVPGVHVVARIDGRNFTRLTREIHQFEAPYDERFRDLMIETTKHLMTSGFQVLYGYTQSDEISLLISPDEGSFGRKTRKWLSILAGEASARFSSGLGDVAAFDCRLCELPTVDVVVDYFRWRNEDAHRNALNGHCYWRLRAEDHGAKSATAALLGMSVAAKNELLYSKGVNFNDLPSWQKRGVGVVWESFEKSATNPITNEPVTALRRRLRVEQELPMRDEYSAFVREIVG